MKKATPTRLPDRKKTGRLHQELPLHLMLLPGLVIILIYNYAPMFGLLKQSVVTPEGEFTLQEFAKFFSKSYYTGTIVNSVKVTLSVTAIALVLGIPIAYFYSFYRIRCFIM